MGDLFGVVCVGGRIDEDVTEGWELEIALDLIGDLFGLVVLGLLFVTCVLFIVEGTTAMDT